MQTPSPHNDAYDNILEAGRLRSEASRLMNRASMYENTAQVQLGTDDASSHVGVRMMNSVLVVAHMGEADGTTMYLPIPQLNDNILLVANPNMDMKAADASTMPMRHRYVPALILQMGGMLAAAVLVPYGKVAVFQRSVTRNASSPAAKAIARAMTEGVGFNPEMAVGVIEAAGKTFEQLDVTNEIATVITLGVVRE